MLIGEPPPTQADLHFSLFGIPVRVHPLFWLVTLFLGYRLRDPVDVLTWIAAVFIAILIHEMGHALAMRAYGFQPWITLYGFGGLTSCRQATGFAPPRMAAGREIAITSAGPAAGFLLAALLLLGLLATGHGDKVFFGSPWGLTPIVLLENMRIAMLFNHLFFICVMWGLINLLPIYPLDGGQIARELFLKLMPNDGVRQSLILSLFAATAMAIVGIVLWKSVFVAIMFGYLAYSSFVTLQAYSGRYPW